MVTPTATMRSFFEWLKLLNEAQRPPFKNLVCIKLPRDLVDAIPKLILVANHVICEVFRERHQDRSYGPHYFSKLANFVDLLRNRRLKVFTLNYDFCVENACTEKGINFTTGFSYDGGTFNSTLFETNAPGINLYKLHGSLDWFMEMERDSFVISQRRSKFFTDIDKTPQLVLGPGLKLQTDEPFITLYAEFSKAVRTAKVCIIIGYGYRDRHINEPLGEASRQGLAVIDVNPTNCGPPSGARIMLCRRIQVDAKSAFNGGRILKEVMDVFGKKQF